MPEPTIDPTDSRFTLFAVRKGDTTPLLQIKMPWDRLVNDVVEPYDAGEMFFIDGAPVKAIDLDRIKILLNGSGFSAAFGQINWHMKTGDTKSKEMYAKQYAVFIEAMIREHCTDVTSQVIRAFRTAIKPRLRDHLPDKNALLDAGIKLLTESMKAWSAR